MADVREFADFTETDIEESKELELVAPNDISHPPSKEASAQNSARLEQAGVIPTLILSDSTAATSVDHPNTSGVAGSNTDAAVAVADPDRETGTSFSDEKDTPGEENKPDDKSEAVKPGDQTTASVKPEVTLSQIENDVLGTVQERTTVVNGATVRVRTPEQEKYKHLREVQIGEQTIKLSRDPRSNQKWFYSEMKEGAKVEDVKLHVAGLNSDDMAKLHKELLPLLEKLRNEGSVIQYKTFDPNFLDPKFQDHASGVPANGAGQNSKGFTIYLPVDKASEVAKIIDKFLVERGLTLPADYKTGTVGDSSRAKTDSRRVSVERDLFDAVSEYPGGNKGAVIDERVQRELEKAYGLLGMNGKDLGWDALRQIEKDAGLAPEQLTYDRSGKMIFITPASMMMPSGQLYLDENKAVKTPGQLTGRPALYALYGMMEADPAQAKVEEVEAKKKGAKPVESQAKPDTKFSSTMQDALDRAKDLVSDGPEVKTTEQVKQLLKNTLDEIDRSGDWSEAKREEFQAFQKAYADGVPDVVKFVHKAIGLPVPETAAVSGAPVADSSIKDLKTDAVAVDQRTAATATVLQEGPVKATLVKQGVKEEKAAELAKDLVSEDATKREEAAKKIAEHYQTKGGMRAFMGEFKGRAGAAAIVATPIISNIIEINK